MRGINLYHGTLTLSLAQCRDDVSAEWAAYCIVSHINLTVIYDIDGLILAVALIWQTV